MCSCFRYYGLKDAHHCPAAAVHHSHNKSGKIQCVNFHFGYHTFHPVSKTNSISLDMKGTGGKCTPVKKEHCEGHQVFILLR